MCRKNAKLLVAEYGAIGVILILFAVLSCVGITWGLPSRSIDEHLFGGEEPWSGEKILRLAGAKERFSPNRGADVDVDPLAEGDGEPIHLTQTEEDVAKIYLRYRLYTYQPDEMITMMALAGMNPRRLQFDPRLYQYGGLFIYPVGGLIAACDVIGLIDVRGDVAYYLDNPEEFGKFYIVARAYSAFWGLIGVLTVFALARRLGGCRAGWLAALLFTLMPVVICMAHEGKPHLPGAVLMLLAVLFAMRYLDGTKATKRRSDGATDGVKGRRDEGTEGLRREATETNVAPPPVGCVSRSAGFSPREHSLAYCGSNRDWWLMCLCCGAALGAVLSSAPIFVLIPLVAWIASTQRTGASRWVMFVKQTVFGICVATVVYLITNPYILINVFANRDVLESNFGNSLAMYRIDRLGEGFVRVLELTVEGATLPLLVLGTIALLVALVRTNRASFALAVPAAVFFLQFVLIGAGKPAEYGRFGVFTNTALAIGAACLLANRWTRLRDVVNWIPATFVLFWVCLYGGHYLGNFRADAMGRGSRSWDQLTANVGLESLDHVKLLLLAEPAPYCCPPLPFSSMATLFFQDRASALKYHDEDPLRRWYIVPVDQTAQPRERNRQPLFGPIQRWFMRRYYEVYILPGRFWAHTVETPISWANKPFDIRWPYTTFDRRESGW